MCSFNKYLNAPRLGMSLKKKSKINWWVRTIKKVFSVLNYIEHLHNLASTVNRCISISAFASLVGIPILIMSSAVGLKICVITAGNKKYKSRIKKKNNKHDKILLLAKTKLNSIEVITSLINSNIRHGKFLLINKMPKEYNDTKEEINNFKTS